MLYKVKTIFPRNLYFNLYSLLPYSGLFFKNLRFNFWLYSPTIEENYYFLINNILLALYFGLFPSIFYSSQRMLLCSIKSCAFKWRFHFQITGLGLKLINVDQSHISFTLGFSHNVVYSLKENIFALRTTRQKQSFKLFGLDLSVAVLLVGIIKRLKHPDVYKGKGLRFHKEKLKLRKREKFSR